MSPVVIDVGDTQTTRQIRGRLLAIAWPAVLENVVQSAIFMANTALAGRLGAEALAAAGVSNLLMFFSFAIFSGIGVGTLALVARGVGAGDLEMAGSAGQQGLITGTALSLIPVFVLGLFAAPVLGLLGADESIVKIAVPYLVVSVMFSPFQAIIVMVGSIMRGAGDTRTPMIGSVVMAVLDVVIGALLVFDLAGPRGLGLMGIAIALSLARVSACVFMLAAMYRSPLRAAVYGSYRLDLDSQRRLWRVSGPAATEQIITVGGIMAFSIIGLRLGTVSFAAQSVIGVIISLGFMPAFGLGMAASAAVGQSLGARNAPLARRFGREAAIGGTLLSTLVGIAVIVFPRELMAVFTSDVAVIDAGEVPVRIMGLFMPVLGLATTLPGALRGSGDTRAMLLISLLGLWVARIPLAIVLGFWAGFGLAGIWTATGINYVVVGTVALARFASGRWLKISV